MPIVTEVLDPSEDMVTPYNGKRPSVKEFVVDFVLKELSESEPDLLSYEDARSANRIGRLSKPMARTNVAHQALHGVAKICDR